MRKILLLWLLCNTHFLMAQSISDTNFANAIRNLYPSLIEANNNNLTPAASTYTGALDLSGWGNATKSDGTASAYGSQPKLTSIDGIVYFAQLKGLNVSNQSLVALPGMSNSIVFVVATNNQLTSIPSTLPTSLEYLRLSQNNLTELPTLPAGLKALKCNNNQLTQLPTLPASLAYLDVSFNATLGCLPTVPHDLVNNNLPTSTLTTYVFSSNATRRLDFSNTAIRCIPNLYASAWAYEVTLPAAPGLCSEVPVMKYAITGASLNQNNGSVTVIGTMPSPNAKMEYRLNNGAFQESNIFTGLTAGTHTAYARRKSESSSCVSPETSVTFNIPVKTQKSIYVSPLGSDITGNGTSSNPFRSITKALSTTFAGSEDTVLLAPGSYIEDQVLQVPSTVSVIGSGSDSSLVSVNVFYNPFDYPTSTTNPEPLWREYEVDYSKFVFQIQGNKSRLKGFSVDGQSKKCLGAVYGGFAAHTLIEDLNIQNFRYTALVLAFADSSVITKCYIKNSTYGTYLEDKACIYIDGVDMVISHNTILLDENIGGYGIKFYFPIRNQVYFFQEHDLYKEDEYALGLTIENNTILVNEKGLWNNYQSPAFTFENFQDCKNCIIRNNILNNVLSLVDNGAHSNGSFYAGPRYNIYNNTFNLFDGGMAVESMAPNIEFHHNYIFGGGGLNSYASSVPSNYYDGANYHHNVFYSQKGAYPLSGWMQPPLNFKFNNNTIIDYRGSSIFLGHNSINRNMEVKNNIFANLDPTITTTPINRLNEIDNTNSVISNNLFYNIAPYGTNSLVANPQLLGAGMKPFTHFQLKKGSPAIDAGLIIPGTTDGYKGAAPDLGAYESDFENTDTNTADDGWLGIGTNRPEYSAAIDILSNTQGILVPRLPLAIIQNMPSPAEGLLVFCSDCSPKTYYYSDGVNWQKQEGGITLGVINATANTDQTIVSIGALTPQSSAALDINNNEKGLLLPRIDTFDNVQNPTEGLMVYLKTGSNKGVYFYDGNKWIKAFKTITAFAINNGTPTNSNTGIGINTINPHPSAALEINTATKGLLPPRLGKTQMETIKSPAVGLLVYCYDCPMKGYYYNNGTNWQNSVVTPPSAPQQVRATPNGSSVTVSFNAPVSDGGSGIINYTLVAIPGNSTVNTTSTSAVFTGLLTNVSYVFLVAANNSEGASATTASNAVIIGVPDAPKNVYAYKGTVAGTADVYFTPPVHSGGSPITNYTVTVMPDNISYTATQSPFTVSGLTLNSTYTFTIKANNANGSSLPALTNAVTSGNAILVANRPLDNLSALPTVAYGLRKLISTYNGPAIELRRESDNQTLEIGFDNEGNLNVGIISNFCGISKGYVTKWYDQSGNTRDVVNTNQADQPLIYNGFSVESLNGKPVIKFLNSSQYLRTPQNVLTNSNEITTFTTAYAGYYQNIFQHGNGSGNGHMLGRRVFANYGFVLNWNDINETIFSDGSTNAALRLLTCRNSVTDARRHIRVNGNNSNSVNSVQTVNFTNDKLTIGQGFTGHMGEHIEYNSYIPLTAIEQIENNQSLYFQILQPCLANSVPPTAPTQVFASSVSNTSASISFNPSTNSGSRPIKYYEVSSSPGNFKQIAENSPIVMTGLSAGVTYNFSVKAVNFCDEESQAVNSNSIVLGQVDAPSNVSVVKGVAEGSAVVSFTAPTFTNNQTITGYTVTSAPDNVQVTGSTSPITITGLSDEKKYTFTVVAHTTITNSLPSLASNSIYTHTQILNDMPTPKAAFGLRRLLSTYAGPAVTIRRNDNTTQDIGFLPNGELDEAALLTFVGSGNGFVTKWYDQSTEAKHASISVVADQPLLVSNGAVCKHQGQTTIRFYSSDIMNVPALTNVRTLHTIFSMGDATSGGTDTTSLNYGFLLGQSFTSNFGGNGLDHDWQNTLLNRLRWSGTFYETATLFVNGTDKTNIANNYGLNIREYKSMIASVNNNVNASFTIKDIRAIGSNYSNLSTFLFFGQNLSSTDRQKLDKRESACFELGF